MQDQNDIHDKHAMQDLDIKELEQKLADLSPNPLSNDLLTRMEQAMASWELHLPVEEKIVPFESVQQKKSSFPIWSAAAAVALMGTVGAIFYNTSSVPENGDLYPSLAQIGTDATTPSPAPISKHFSHQLTNASNEGITYGADQRPYKVFKIEYTKEVKTKDAKGRVTTRKEPTVEVILVPVEVH